MISYGAYYEVGTRPSIRKVVEASDSTYVYTNLNYSNEDERENASDEIISQHIENLHLHMKDVTNKSRLLDIKAPLMSEIVVEWNDIQSIYSEIAQWWMLVSFRPEEDTHDDSDHTAGAETGEETSNA
jgi:hypothetical protein